MSNEKNEKKNEKLEVVKTYEIICGHKIYILKILKPACPYKHDCGSLDLGSLPLCQKDYTSCQFFIEKDNPKLYKEFFGKC